MAMGAATAVACREKMPLLLCILLLAASPRHRGATAAAAASCNGSVAARCPLPVGGAAPAEWHAETSEAGRRALTEGYNGDHIAYGALERLSCRNPAGGPYTQGHGCVAQRVNRHTRGCNSFYKCRGAA